MRRLPDQFPCDPHKDNAAIVERGDDAVGVIRIGGEGIDGHTPHHRQVVERVRRLAADLDDRQALASQPEPAPAVSAEPGNATAAVSIGAAASLTHRARGASAPGRSPAGTRPWSRGSRRGPLRGWPRPSRRGALQAGVLEVGTIGQAEQASSAVEEDPGRPGFVDGAQAAPMPIHWPRSRRRGSAHWRGDGSIGPSLNRTSSLLYAFHNCPSGVRKQARESRRSPRDPALRPCRCASERWPECPGPIRRRADRDDRPVATDQVMVSSQSRRSGSPSKSGAWGAGSHGGANETWLPGPVRNLQGSLRVSSDVKARIPSDEFSIRTTYVDRADLLQAVVRLLAVGQANETVHQGGEEQTERSSPAPRWGRRSGSKDRHRPHRAGPIGSRSSAHAASSIARAAIGPEDIAEGDDQDRAGPGVLDDVRDRQLRTVRSVADSGARVLFAREAVAITGRCARPGRSTRLT